MTIEIPRRAFIGGLLGIIAAPAIVKATNLMPVKSMMERERWVAMTDNKRWVLELSNETWNTEPIGITYFNFQQDWKVGDKVIFNSIKGMPHLYGEEYTIAKIVESS